MGKYLMLIVMIVFICVSAGHAEQDMLHVVYTQWEPYTYQENDKDSGFEIETVRAVIGKMGLRSKFEQLPWKRCLITMEKGGADVLVSALKTPEREKFLYYPDEFISLSKTVFFTKKGSSIEFDGSFEGLKNYNIGIIRGFSYGDAFDKAVYLKKDEVNDTDGLVKMVLAGRNELGAENMAVITASAKKQGVLDNIRFLEKPIHSQKLYVVFSKVRALEKSGNTFSETLREFKKTEDYRKILEKYGMKVSDMTD
jgi:polar amino acid transport system substrate-binding protein